MNTIYRFIWLLTITGAILSGCTTYTITGTTECLRIVWNFTPPDTSWTINQEEVTKQQWMDKCTIDGIDPFIEG
jgi:hypothetical protein